MSEGVKKNRVEVAVAILRRRNRFLIAKRPKGKAYAGKWEFPGGKIEHGELPHECLLREIYEELGIAIVVQKPLHVFDYAYPDGAKFRFHVFLCKAFWGEPQPLWHEDICWKSLEDTATLDLLEADQELIPLLKDL